MEPVKLNKLIGKTEYTEREKQMGCAVKDLYVFLFDRKHKNWRKAMDLLGPCYVQHNPMIPDGRQGLLDWAALLRKRGSASSSTRWPLMGTMYSSASNWSANTGKTPAGRGRPLPLRKRKNRGTLGRDTGNPCGLFEWELHVLKEQAAVYRQGKKVRNEELGVRSEE